MTTLWLAVVIVTGSLAAAWPCLPLPWQRHVACGMASDVIVMLADGVRAIIWHHHDDSAG